MENHPWVTKADGLLYPIFTIVVLIQLYLILYLIRTKDRSERSSIKRFETGEDFDDYLRYRLKRAVEIRVVHISSGTSQDRSYPDIIDDFLKRGGKFSRIFSDSANPEVVKWIWNDLKKYEDNRYGYFMYCLKNIRVEKETRTFGIMLIDDAEVCLGGGYHMKFTQPTICLREAAIVKFFDDYYHYLERHTIGVRIPGKSVNWETMKTLFPQWQEIGLSS